MDQKPPTFAEQLTALKCTAKLLMMAFPGIPKSTAYDWCSGEREPLDYLQGVVLAHVQDYLKKLPLQGQGGSGKMRKS